MLHLNRLISLLTIIILSFIPSCDSGNPVRNGTYDPGLPSVFAYSPVEISKLNFLLSLGWIQPVGHTIPTDHVYFWAKQYPTPVYAPGGGRVEKILDVPILGIKEVKIWIRMNLDFSYYLDHIVLDSSIKEGSDLVAGQVLGTTGLGPSIDLGAIDQNVVNNFINPARYADQTVHCGKPFTYFVDSIKSKLYALVDREGADKDGRVDLDVKGRLIGNWFLDSTIFFTDGPGGWDKELSFAYDIQHPTKALVSIGGTIGMVGKWDIPSDAIQPLDVMASTGKVSYKLSAGLLIVQVLDDRRIKVQPFPGSSQSTAEFDAAARIYAR